MPRYRIKVQEGASFEDVLKVARSATEVFVTSEKRRTLSTGDIPEEIKGRLETMGARVTPEFRYEIGRVPGGDGTAGRSG